MHATQQDWQEAGNGTAVESPVRAGAAASGSTEAEAFRSAWIAQREAGMSWLGRWANAVRVAIATGVVWVAHYIRVQLELHLRRSLPRHEHYLVMRLFQCLGRTFPVTIDYPNPVGSLGQRLVMTFNLSDNHAVFFRRRDQYEAEWLRLIGVAMEEASGFIDVGAHAGMYALAVAQAFPDRRVLALEPHPGNVARLRHNIRLNKLGNVEVIQAAVTDEPGSATFFLNPLQDGGGSLKRFETYRTGDVALDARTYQTAHPRFQASLLVETRTLDALVTAKSILKVDVEGGEVAVLRSGRRAFAAGFIDLAVVEVEQGTVREVVTFFEEVGHDCFLYGRRLPLAPDARLRWRIENLIVLRRQSPLYQRLDFV